MSIEDKENLYILEEEEKKELIESSQIYSIEEDEETDEDKIEQQEIEKKRSAFGLLFSIMFNPVEGWKRLRRSKASIEELQAGCFYPLLAILAVSTFSEYIYSVNVNLQSVISNAVVTFVAFFFGYFCIQMVLSWFLPKDVVKKFEEKFGKEYLIIALSSLALFSVFTNVLPMLWPILIFLPIWTLYLMFKGVRFFKFPANQEMKFFLISGVAVIGIPVLIDWILKSILPY